MTIDAAALRNLKEQHDHTGCFIAAMTIETCALDLISGATVVDFLKLDADLAKWVDQLRKP